MKITDILRERTIIPELRASNKNEAILKISLILSRSSGVDTEEINKILMERESLGSTGIGDGVAVPHGKCKEIEHIYGCFAKSTPGVDFDSVDGQKAHLIFGLIAPDNSASEHLRALAKISRLLRNRQLRDKLIDAGDGRTLMNLLKSADEKEEVGV